MKKTNRPSASKLSVFRQICNLIPEHLVPKLARETGVDKKCRTFSAWSHVVAMLYGQFTHCIGLNDACDALELHSGPLSAIRGATPPSRNGLSHAGKERTAELPEKLFWKEPHVAFGRGLAAPVLGPVHAGGNQLNSRRVHDMNGFAEAVERSFASAPFAKPGREVLQMFSCDAMGQPTAASAQWPLPNAPISLGQRDSYGTAETCHLTNFPRSISTLLTPFFHLPPLRPLQSKSARLHRALMGRL